MYHHSPTSVMVAATLRGSHSFVMRGTLLGGIGSGMLSSSVASSSSLIVRGRLLGGSGSRLLSSTTTKTWSLDGKLLRASPMVYIAGEEMTRYAMELIVNRWIKPNVDVSKWQFYDLS